MLDKTFAFLQALDATKAFKLKKREDGVYTDEDMQEVDPAVYGLWNGAMDEVKALRAMPEVVMLAGSSRFKQAFEQVAEAIALQGKIVLGKSVYKPGKEWPLSDREKDMIHAVQFRTCDLASRLHIVNVDGYVGQDTYNLIRYALRTERVVTFHEPVVRLLSDQAQAVDTDWFLKATRRRVEFEEAAVG